MAITSTMDGATLPAENANSTNDQPDQSQFKVHVKRKTLFWMLIKYGFLTIITLGIYRFWAKTKIRRYLWSTVEFSGDRFEYHGTAKELFIGFLIALVILVPISLLNEAIAASISEDNIAGNLAYIFTFFSVLLFLFEFAFYRMRRYQLTRTSWRSIRFGLDGSATQYAFISTLWIYSLFFSLGLTYPFYVAWRNREFLNNSSFGNSHLKCSLTGTDLLKSFFILYGIAILSALITSFPILSIFLEIGFNLQDEHVADLFVQEIEKRDVNFYLFPLTAWAAFVGFLIYKLYIFRATLNKLKIENATISSIFSIPKLVWWGFLSVVAFLVTFFIVSFVSFALGLILTVGVGVLSTYLSGGFDINLLLNSGVGPVGIIIPLLLTVVITRAVSLTLFPVTLMRTVIPNTKLDMPEELTEIIQTSSAMPTHGEGFADALDVGAF